MQFKVTTNYEIFYIYMCMCVCPLITRERKGRYCLQSIQGVIFSTKSFKVVGRVGAEN